MTTRDDEITHPDGKAEALRKLTEAAEAIGWSVNANGSLPVDLMTLLLEADR